MNTSNPINDLVNSLLGRIPNWVGFGIIIIIGIIALVVGAVNQPAASVGLIAFGIWAIGSAILAWATGGSSRPDGFNGSFGATITSLRPWVWWVVFAGLVVVIILAIAVRP